MRVKLIVKQLLMVLIVIGTSGIAFAHEHESFRNERLLAMFEQTNQHYFAGELQNVEVRWANLKSEDARAITRPYGRWSFLIEVDRDTNNTSRITQVALNHEACHVATYFQIEQEHSHLHGPLFRNCMRRFSGRKPPLHSGRSQATRYFIGDKR
jgi:SprT-like family